MNRTSIKQSYFWKILIVILGIIVLSATFMKSPGFITSYMVDIAGPAWIYILIRVQYSTTHSTFLSIKFSPEFAALLIIGISVIIETSQYYEIYDAHFDPYDYVAYISGTVPIYLLDKWILIKKS